MKNIVYITLRIKNFLYGMYKALTLRAYLYLVILHFFLFRSLEDIFLEEPSSSYTPECSWPDCKYARFVGLGVKKASWQHSPRMKLFLEKKV